MDVFFIQVLTLATITQLISSKCLDKCRVCVCIIIFAISTTGNVVICVRVTGALSQSSIIVIYCLYTPKCCTISLYCITMHLYCTMLYAVPCTCMYTGSHDHSTYACTVLHSIYGNSMCAYNIFTCYVIGCSKDSMLSVI